MLHLSVAIMGFGAVGSVCCAGLLDVPMPWRRVVGLRFWRIGRLGGSFYVAPRHGGASVRGDM